MAKEKKSEKFKLVIGGKVVAKASDFSISNSKGTIDVRTLDSDGWATSIADEKGVTISTSAMYIRPSGSYSGTTSYEEILNDVYNDDEPVTIFVQVDESGEKYQSGKFHITSLDLTVTTGDVIKYSASFQSTGEVEVLTLTP